MSGAVFNKEAFYLHLGGDVELGAEILAVYLEDAPKRVQSLIDALNKEDQNGTVKFAHALKGISATIRAERIAFLSERAEKAARKGELGKVKDILSDIREELNLVIESVRNAL